MKNKILTKSQIKQTTIGSLVIAGMSLFIFPYLGIAGAGAAGFVFLADKEEKLSSGTKIMLIISLVLNLAGFFYPSIINSPHFNR